MTAIKSSAQVETLAEGRPAAAWKPVVNERARYSRELLRNWRVHNRRLCENQAPKRTLEMTAIKSSAQVETLAEDKPAVNERARYSRE
jgi:cell division protein FtsB